MFQYEQAEIPLPEAEPAPSNGQYFVSAFLDGGRIPAIIIGIMYENSSGETYYIFFDAYGRIYSTTTKLMIDPT